MKTFFDVLKELLEFFFFSAIAFIALLEIGVFSLMTHSNLIGRLLFGIGLIAFIILGIYNLVIVIKNIYSHFKKQYQNLHSFNYVEKVLGDRNVIVNLLLMLAIDIVLPFITINFESIAQTNPNEFWPLATFFIILLLVPINIIVVIFIILENKKNSYY